MDYIQDRTIWPKLEEHITLKRYAKVVKEYFGVNNLKLTEFHPLWKDIKRKCYIKSHEEYPLYGGRGIKMCDKWSRHWLYMFSDMGPIPTDETYPNGSTVWDIILINKNDYYLGNNCKWFDTREKIQVTNKAELDMYVEFQGIYLSINEWCSLLGPHSVDQSTMINRMKEMSNPEDILRPDKEMIKRTLDVYPDIFTLTYTEDRIVFAVYRDIIECAKLSDTLLSTIVEGLNSSSSDIGYLVNYSKGLSAKIHYLEKIIEHK